MKSLAAGIEISAFGESCHNAIESILRHQTHFKEIHIVQYGHTDKDKKELPCIQVLADASMPVFWHQSFDPNRCGANAVVWFPPEAVVHEAAMESLVKRIECADTNDQSRCWFSIRGKTEIALPVSNGPLDPPTRALSILQTLAYGFLVALSVLDWFGMLWDLNKHHLQNDLRAEFLVRTYQNRTRRPTRTWLLNKIWNLQDDYTQHVGSSLENKVTHDPLYVLRRLREHKHIKIGLWTLAFIFYYWAFAFPWWSWLTYGSSWSWIRYLTVPPFHPVRIGCYLVLITLSIFTAWPALQVPHGMKSLLIVLQPLYLAAFPLVWLYSKIHM